MKRAVLWLFALVVLGAIGFAAFRFYDERQFAATRYGEGPRTVVVPPRNISSRLSRVDQVTKSLVT